MAATPAFRAAGAVVATANNVGNPTTLTPALPAGRVTADTLLCITSSRSNTATVATPTGWSLVTGFPLRSATASGGTIYIFAESVDGSEAAPPCAWTGLATGTTGDSAQAVVLAYSGLKIASLVDGAAAKGSDAAVTTPIVVPGVTTTLLNTLLLSVAIRINDTAHTFTGGQTNERVDSHTTSGTGHGLQITDAVQAAAGASASANVVPSATVSSRVLGITVGIAAADTFNQPVADTATVADNVLPAERGVQTVADDVVLVDDVVGREANFATLASSVIVLDDTTATESNIQNITGDTAAVADSASTQSGQQTSAADAAVVADSATTETGKGTSVADTATVADSSSTQSGKSASLADSVTVADGEIPPSIGGYKLGENLIAWDAGQTFTVEMDFRMPNVGTTPQPLLGQAGGSTTVGGGNSGYVPVVYFDNAGFLRVSTFWHGQTNPPLVGNVHEFDDGQLHRVGVTYNGTDQVVVVDGVQRSVWTLGQNSYAAIYSYFAGAAVGAGVWSGIPNTGDPWFYATQGWVGNFQWTQGTAKTAAQIGTAAPSGVTTQSNTQRTLADTATVADALRFDYGEALADAAGVADSASTASAVAVVTTDAITVADAATAAAVFNQPLADAVSVADATATARAISSALADAATVADAQSLQRNIQQALTDAATVADSSTTASGKGADLADTLVVADNVALLRGWGRVVADALGVTDATLTILSGSYIHHQPPLSGDYDQAAGGVVVAVIGDGTVTVYDAQGVVVTMNSAGQVVDARTSGTPQDSVTQGVVADSSDSGVGV